MGMGRRYLDLQCCLLRPSRLVEVLHSLRPKWQGLAQFAGEQGMNFMVVAISLVHLVISRIR